jgi:hypothetical protein
MVFSFGNPGRELHKQVFADKQVKGKYNSRD